MRYHQECLLHALASSRWELRWPVGSLRGDEAVWWLGHRGTASRFVTVAFDTDRLEGSRHPRPRAIVRPAVVPPGPPVEAAFDLGDELQQSFGGVLTALDFFRDPGDWVAGSAPPGGWEPPPEWLGLSWPAESGGEALWRQWSDAPAMLDLILPSLTARKQLLLACAVCRQMPLAMLRPANVEAVEVAGRYADSLCPRRQMKKACKHSALGWLAELDPNEAVVRAVSVLRGETNAAEALACAAVREVVTNPFCPVESRREWLRNNGLAAGRILDVIEGERRFEDMPILADALEDAGCSAAPVLDHCRGGGPHLRGCWVLDLLGGRPERRERRGR